MYEKILDVLGTAVRRAYHGEPYSFVVEVDFGLGKRDIRIEVSRPTELIEVANVKKHDPS